MTIDATDHHLICRETEHRLRDRLAAAEKREKLIQVGKSAPPQDAEPDLDAANFFVEHAKSGTCEECPSHVWNLARAYLALRDRLAAAEEWAGKLQTILDTERAGRDKEKTKASDEEVAEYLKLHKKSDGDDCDLDANATVRQLIARISADRRLIRDQESKLAEEIARLREKIKWRRDLL